MLRQILNLLALHWTTSCLLLNVSCESSRELASSSPQEEKALLSSNTPIEKPKPSTSPAIETNTISAKATNPSHQNKVEKKPVSPPDSSESPSHRPEQDHPNQGAQKLGEACSASNRCADNLGCDGLFYEKAGKCIQEQAASSACVKAGGEWGRWGMMQSSFCMRLMPDAGKPCTNSSQCQGKCIKKKEQPALCQKYEKEFGCYQVIETETGPNPTMCMD